MANDVAKFFGGHQLPDRAKLSTALAGFSAAKNALMGKALLRMTKQGTWVFGADSETIATGTRLVANPASLMSGYVAWYQSKIEGEKMQPLSLGPIDPNELGEVQSGSIPPGKKQASGKGWEAQASIDFITQDEIPLSLVYKSSSMGGMRALLELAGEIAAGMEENPARCYPLVEIEVDSYVHKEFGQVFTPVLDIVGWLDAEGKEVKDGSSLL